MSDEEQAERDHWHDVMRTFLHYENFVQLELQRRQDHLNRLPQSLSDRLPDITFEKISALHDASRVNQQFFNEMVHFHASTTCHDEDGNPVIPTKSGPAIHPSQQHRNQAVLHSLFREWSKEGKAERSVPFEAIINELKTFIPVTKGNAYKQRVLVPGCGTGRLPVDIASHGYSVEGNEFSAYMAIASHFMLNGVYDKDSFDIFPWIETICNIVNVRDTLAPVMIPDVPAVDILNSFNTLYPELVESDGNTVNELEKTTVADAAQSNSTADSVDDTGSNNNNGGDKVLYPRFSMSTGDFVEIYGGDRSHREAWDCVVTCFFVDTAPVVLEYIDVIHRILKPGGVWVNLGPLLYHWVADADGNQDERYQQSIELSYEELKYVVQGYGFRFVSERFLECNYTRNPASMMHTVYNTVLFSARKPALFCEECTSPTVFSKTKESTTNSNK